MELKQQQPKRYNVTLFCSILYAASTVHVAAHLAACIVHVKVDLSHFVFTLYQGIVSQGDRVVIIGPEGN